MNVAEVRRFPIPVPIRPSEQARIEEAINSSDRGAAAEVSVLAKLRALRSGLMADLLNGRVSVPESLFAAEAHV